MKTSAEQEVITLSYGIGSAKGELFQDRVCLDSGAQICVDNLKMLGLTSASQLNNVRSSGLIGMGPMPFDYRCELFVSRLKQTRQIPKALFSIYITDYFKALEELGPTYAGYQDGNIAKGSTIMIGGYDLDKFSKPGEQIEWLNLVQSHYWSL